MLRHSFGAQSTTPPRAAPGDVHPRPGAPRGGGASAAQRKAWNHEGNLGAAGGLAIRPTSLATWPMQDRPLSRSPRGSGEASVQADNYVGAVAMPTTSAGAATPPGAQPQAAPQGARPKATARPSMPPAAWCRRVLTSLSQQETSSPLTGHVEMLLTYY